jgi:hypothetical protein
MLRSFIGGFGLGNRPLALMALFAAILSSSVTWSSVAGAATMAGGEAGEPGPPNIDWNQIENIQSAARRIAHVQRRQGADAALKLIGDCYKTHSLSQAYSQGFEGCIAQDYMQTRVLVQVYGRLPPEVIKKLNVPSAEDLAQSMGRRLVNGFAKYKISVAYAKTFKDVVDEHGWPVFLKIVFPNAAPKPQPTKPDLPRDEK